MSDTACTEARSLAALRAHFLATSTRSLPLAGLICWSALGAVAPTASPGLTGTLALYIMGAIVPLAFILDGVRGRNPFAGGSENPLTQLFLLSIVGVGLTVPLVIAAAQEAGEPLLVVLGMAILAGVIWIPYGWAAGDPVGIRHAVARGVGCYLAYAFAPDPWRATAVCGVVALAYLYSLLTMRRPWHPPRPTADGSGAG